MLKTLTLLGVCCIALAQPDFHHPPPPHRHPAHPPPHSHHAHPPPERLDGIVFPSQSGEDYNSSSGSSEMVDKFTFNRPNNGGNSVYGGGRPAQGGGGRPQGGGGRPQQQQGGGGGSRNGGLQVLFSWKQVDFVFQNNSMRENMIRNQQFIPRNNLILDVDVYGEGSNRRVFVTLPRVRPGVPVTLARVSSRKRNGKNLLRPFPNWQSQVPGDCNGITSVFRTHIDPCGRLWVLDSGNNNAFNGQGNRIVCNPQVLIYDLRNNDRLVGRYRIPMSMIESNTLLVTIAVDIRQADCSDAYAYIADSIAYKMIVFNLRRQEFWRINSIHFFPYPDQSRFTVNGVSFDLMGGLFGLSIGPKYRNKRRLYFHCIDSVRQSWVDTDDLRNQTLWRDNMNAKPRAFNLFSGSRTSQSASATMDEDGIMYFGLIGSNEISCWNSRQRFARSNLVSLAKDDLNLQFNSGIKVYGNKLYVATSRLQNYVTSQVKEDEENYRVLEGDVNQLTQGTKCQTSGPLSTRVDEYEPDSENVEFPFSV